MQLKPIIVWIILLAIAFAGGFFVTKYFVDQHNASIQQSNNAQTLPTNK